MRARMTAPHATVTAETAGFVRQLHHENLVDEKAMWGSESDFAASGAHSRPGMKPSGSKRHRYRKNCLKVPRSMATVTGFQAHNRDSQPRSRLAKGKVRWRPAWVRTYRSKLLSVAAARR